MRTAVYVSEAPNFKTDAILWKLGEPLGGYEFVITSIADNDFAKETMVFGYTSEDGVNWGDLEWFPDSPDHLETLNRLGYRIVS